MTYFKAGRVSFSPTIMAFLLTAMQHNFTMDQNAEVFNKPTYLIVEIFARRADTQVSITLHINYLLQRTFCYHAMLI